LRRAEHQHLESQEEHPAMPASPRPLILCRG